MPSLTVNDRRLTYDTAGGGFPLILVPDVSGTCSDWSPAMPLLGELCRVIAYEYDHAMLPGAASTCPPLCERVADLAAFLDALEVERAYLAGYARGGQIAGHFARQHPGRLEGLVLIGPDHPSQARRQNTAGADVLDPATASLVTLLQGMTVPILLVAGEQAAAHVAWATQLAAQLPHGVKGVIAQAGEAPHQEQPLQLGHVMVRFLLQCERRRTLVRGASFLL